MEGPNDRAESTGFDAFDVAIVGGGIAGLYTAYRLQEAWNSNDGRSALQKQLPKDHDGTMKIVILEQNPYGIGGRVRSVDLPFPGGRVVAELGAMRFTTRQRLVRRLLSELGVHTTPFEGDGFSNHYYLRGKHFDAADIEANDETRFPYHVEELEKRKTPSDLMLHVLECTLKELSLDDTAGPKALLVLEKLRNKQSRETLKHDEWVEIQKHGLLMGHVRLDSIGMWNLIHHYLSPEAAHFVEDGFGYESVIGNWNLSDAIPWFIADFGPGQVYKAVDNSFAELVDRIRGRINSNDDRDSRRSSPFTCKVAWNARVTHLDEIEERIYELNVEETDLEYEHLTSVSTIRAHLVILALPKKPLEGLSIGWLGSGTDRKAEWDTQLAKVRPHRLVKIVQAYRNAWWRTAKTPKGAGQRTFTDLPLRQVYYLDREWLEERGRIKYDHEESRASSDEDKQMVSLGKPDELIVARKGMIADKEAPSRGKEARTLEIGGIVVAYLDGHHASFWRFITTVQRLHDLKRRDLHKIGDRGKRRLAAIKRSIERETEKRDSFGKRIWGWLEPERDDPKHWSTLYRVPVENWSKQQRARHLYFQRYGLYERASAKMTHILQYLHASTQNDRGDRILVPDPVAGAYTFWDNFADSPIPEAGWHTWEPGVNSADAMEKMVRPFGDKAVFVCGEAYSSEQGWIEGALKSVELVMDRLDVLLPGEMRNPDAEPALMRRSKEIRDYVGLPAKRLARDTEEGEFTRGGDRRSKKRKTRSARQA